MHMEEEKLLDMKVSFGILFQTGPIHLEMINLYPEYNTTWSHSLFWLSFLIQNVPSNFQLWDYQFFLLMVSLYPWNFFFCLLSSEFLFF